jgi:hypothetical protein
MPTPPGYLFTSAEAIWFFMLGKMSQSFVCGVFSR